MDVTRWKSILLDWTKKTELVDGDDSVSLESIDLKIFYDKLRSKTGPSLKKDLLSFLTEFFPAFEIRLDPMNNIKPQECMNIFSLILYYSCVIRVSEYFQKCCENLEPRNQAFIMKFFATLKQAQENKESITREALAAAIREAMPSPPSMRFISSSPMMTPDKTPQSPSRSFEKAKELHKVKTMLENERYERNMLDAEVKLNEEKIQSLVKEQKRLKQEIHNLRSQQMIERDSENLSPNKAVRDEQIRHRLQKEIDSREETIVDLRCEIDNFTDKSEKQSNRIGVMEREMKEMRVKICDLEDTVDTLKDDVEHKKFQISVLEENNRDLQSFISETRSSTHKDLSSDCLDYSFSAVTTGANSTDSGENLGKFLIDLQLKEKEGELEQLMSSMGEVKAENEQLRKSLTTESETNSSLIAEVRQKASEIEKLKTKIDANAEETARLKSGIAEAQEVIQKIKFELQANVTAVAEKLKASQADREEFRKLLESEKISFIRFREEHEAAKAEQSEQFKNSIETAKLEHRDQLAALQARISEVEASHAAEIELKIRELNEKNRSFSEAEQICQSQLDLANSQLKDKEDQVRELQQKIANVSANAEETARLKSEIAKSQAVIQEMKVELQANVTAMAEQLKASQDDREEVRKLLESEKASIVKLREEYEAAKAEQSEQFENSIETTKLEHQEQLLALKSQISGLEAKFSENEVEHAAEIELKIRELHEKNRVHAEAEQIYQSQLDLANQQLKNKEDKLKENAEETAKLKSGIVEAQEVIQKMEVEHQLNVTAMSEKLKASEADREEVQNLLEDEKAIFIEFREEREAAKVEQCEQFKNLLETAKVEHQEQLTALQARISEIEVSHAAEIELKIRELHEKNRVHAEVEQIYQSQVDHANQQLKVKEDRMRELQQTIEQKEGELEQLMSSMGAVKDENEQLRKSSTTENQANASLIAEVHQKASEIEKLMTKIDANAEATDSLKSEIASSQELIQKMEVEHQMNVTSVAEQLKASQADREEVRKLLESEKTNFIKFLEEHEGAEAEQSEQFKILLETTKLEYQEKVAALKLQICELDAKFSEIEVEHAAEVELKIRELHEKNRVFAEAEQIYQSQVDLANQKLKNKEDQVRELQQQIAATEASTTSDSTRVQELLKKLTEHKTLRAEMDSLVQIHEREKEFNNKLNEESQVFKAKLIKVRSEKDEIANEFIAVRKKLEKEMIEVKRKADNDVKETRLEYEGKLEKMKDKMKVLFNDEVTKRKVGIEDSNKALNKIIDEQNQKLLEYELITHNVMPQLEQLQKQNRALERSNQQLLFHIKSEGRQQRLSIGMPRMPSTMTQMNGGSYGMEDEAGEEFNNTYLADLKNGGSQAGSLMSLDKNDPYSAAELQKRNSMYPSHMRGSYVICAIDQNLGEQEIKDGGVLDDSKTALIQNNNNNNNRKKQSTSYKRPGPPTPSKLGGRTSIGGRISFGGESQVLKDATNMGAVSKKTPSGFKGLFASRFKDENQKSSPRRLSLFRSKK